MMRSPFTKSSCRPSKGLSSLSVGTKKRILVLLVFGGLASPRTTQGEEPTKAGPPGQGQRWDDERIPQHKKPAAHESAESSICLIGSPRPQCAAIVLGELSGRGGIGGWFFAADIGLLVNQGRSRAFGFTIGAMEPLGTTADAAEDATAFKFRYRHWMGGDDSHFLGSSVDFSLGITDFSEPGSTAGVVMEVAAQAGDMFALMAALQSWPNSKGETELVANVGLRIGLGALQYPLYALLLLDAGDHGQMADLR